jgi:SagB-type dehydrogenase family enzyme
MVIAVGAGELRRTLETNSRALVRWLFDCREPRDRADIESEVARELGLSNPADAAALLDYLINSQVLVTEQTAKSVSANGERWEKAGWRDAFDFHHAGSGLRFDKLYDTEKYRETLENFLSDPRSGPQPDLYKEVKAKQVIQLQDFLPQSPSAMTGAAGASLADTLLRNRPINYYSAEDYIEPSELAETIIEGFGTRRVPELILGPHQFKSYPAGGARHPLELYLAVRRAIGVPQGVYHYHPGTHELAQVNDASALELIDDSGFGKRGICTSAVVLYLTTRWIRHSWKYRYSRSYRMVLMEAGHAVQALRLSGSAANIDVYYSPAIDEQIVGDMLSLEDSWEESPLCCLGLGKGGLI